MKLHDKGWHRDLGDNLRPNVQLIPFVPGLAALLGWHEKILSLDAARMTGLCCGSETDVAGRAVFVLRQA